MPSVMDIRIYPVKGFDAAPVPEARLLPTGALEFDRRWAFVDSQGRFLNGKNCPAIHAIRARYDLDALEIALNGRTYSLTRQSAELAHHVAELVNMPVNLRENPEAGFPDDTDSPGPTLLSSASLEAVADWFSLHVAEARRRFRANIEIGGSDVPPFWEDRLYGSIVAVGAAAFTAVNPCQRCVVPSRDALTGAQDTGFQKRFADMRRANLPDWTVRNELFNHYYRFAVNTRPAHRASTGIVIRTGDSVSIR